MSTRALESYLEQSRGDGDASRSDAVRELRALREACAVVVREKALEDWVSSMPTDLADAIRLIRRVAKESVP